MSNPFLLKLLLMLAAGYLIGLTARALLPGDNGMGFLRTWLLGTVGVLTAYGVCYFFGWLEFYHRNIYTSIAAILLGTMVWIPLFRRRA